MPTQRKVQIVEELTELLSKYRYVLATDYRGLTVSQMAELRQQLRGVDTEYHVVKNNLVRFAAERSGNEELTSLLVGPMALAFSSNDPAKTAKAVIDYARATKIPLSIKGGLLDGRLLSAEQMTKLATLPSADVLRAQLLGTIQSPLYRLQNVLNANIQSLYCLLNSRIQQLGGTADA